MKVPQALKSILIGSYSNIDAIKKFLSLPLKGEGVVERAVLLWPCLENTTWKKAFIDDLFVPIAGGISFIEKKKGEGGKKMGGDETFLLKKKKKER